MHLEERSGRKRRFWAFATHLESGDTESDEDKRVAQAASLAAFISNCGDGAKILGMDGNAFHGFDKGKYAPFDESAVDNMYTTLRKATGMENYPAVRGSVTVNKIRGVMSGQPYKIGAYQLNNIDYIMRSTEHFSMPTSPELPVYNLDARKSAQMNAFSEILPNERCPSDHLPVAATIAWK